FRCVYPEKHRNGDQHPSARWNATKATWRCDVCGSGGGVFDLAEHLHVPRPVPAPPRLEDFARDRCLHLETLRHFGVRPIVECSRPALRYPTSIGIDRVKFLDGMKPKYRWATKGGRAHWYGLERALTALGTTGPTVYIVNGEVSVWACAQAGVPAVCPCSGEG